MGYDLENDFSNFYEKYVCSNCFEDYAISQFIEESTVHDKCSYCGKYSQNSLIAADMNEVMRFIYDGICTEWGDPIDEGVRYVSKEGGWVGTKVIDTYDLIRDRHILGDANDDLIDDIIEALDPLRAWCQIDPYTLLPQEILISTWEQFAEQLKHQTRYVFFKIIEPTQSEDHTGFSQYHQILDYLGQIINDLGLVRKISKGTRFVRVRISSSMKKFRTVEEMGPPPHEDAISSRMSSAGIPLFYSALDIETAIEETYKQTDNPVIISIAEFETMKDIWVLDLRDLPPVPSIFDQSLKDQRPSIIFLNSFRHYITKPIDKDGRVHIEYVPTQVVTEYFHHLYRTDHGKRLNGIFYPSSRIINGCCCVLFYESENCTSNKDDNSGYQEKTLYLVSDSVRHIKIGKT